MDLSTDKGGRDVFVHISAVEKAGRSSLNEGAKVSYEEMSNRGKTLRRKSESRMKSIPSARRHLKHCVQSMRRRLSGGGRLDTAWRGSAFS